MVFADHGGVEAGVEPAILDGRSHPMTHVAEVERIAQIVARLLKRLANSGDSARQGVLSGARSRPRREGQRGQFSTRRHEFVR